MISAEAIAHADTKKATKKAAKTYTAIDTFDNRPVFTGSLEQWDHWFSRNRSIMSKWLVQEDTRTQKTIQVTLLPGLKRWNRV